MAKIQTDRPLALPDHLVRAVLAGHKTQHRVPAVLPEHPNWTLWRDDNGLPRLGRITSRHPKQGRFGVFIRREIHPGSGKYEHSLVPCPFGGPGDTLWVREAHAIVPATAYRGSTGIAQTVNPDAPDDACVYRENFDRSRSFPWRPSTHMPRWASRAHLQVMDVRLERLGDLSEDDAIAEGARHFPDLPGLSRWGQDNRWSLREPETVNQCLGTARMALANDWCYRFGKTRRGVMDFRPWDENPYVWVAEFVRVDTH